MKKIFNKFAINLIIIVALFGQCFYASAEGSQQERTITGVVLDIEGAPLPGVSVMVQGTAKGTTSDSNGAYSIRVSPEEQIIVLSMVGFQTQEITIGANNVINVVLRESTVELEDLVVVGYGTQKRISVTGALSTINVERLVSVPNATFTNSLGGQLPGLITKQTSGEPGFDAAQIYIRGISTFTGVRGPLVLVDGIERDLSLVNPMEVDNITILKDASATAVYGVKGANGVILINTKKGIKQAPQVSLRTEWAVLSGLRFPKFIDGYEFASLMNEASKNSERPVLPFFDWELEKFKEQTDPFLYPSVNWPDAVYRKHGWQSVNNLGIRGGAEVVRYYVNAGFTTQSGLYNSDKSLDYNTNGNVNRFNFRSNVDVNVSKNLVIDLGLGAVIQQRSYQGTPAGDISLSLRQISPIAFPILNPDGSISGGPSYMVNNPWALTTQSGYTNMYRNTVQGTFGARWDLSDLITPGLALAGRFAFDAFNHSEIFRQIAFGVKQFNGYDSNGNEQYTEHRPAGTMGSRVDSWGNRSVYWDVTLNYNRSFMEHNVGAMLLFNRREYVNNQAIDEIENIAERRQGLAGRLTYDYRQRYLFEFNFGYNGSEQFPKGDRYGFFPSVSAGWNITQENFWNVDIVNQLKIRASHGQVGNDQLGSRRFLYMTKMNTAAWGYFYGPAHLYSGNGIQEAQIGAPNVTWEVATKTNVGFDLGMFDNQLTLQADAFYEIRDNILVRRATSVPDFAGYIDTPWGNVGRVENRGVDGLIEFKKMTTGGFYYSLRGNFTFARNKILENDEPERLWDYQSGIGQRIDQPFGYISLGIFKDEQEILDSPKQMLMEVIRPGDYKYLDKNDDGFVDEYDRVPIGYGQTPEIMYGFGGTVAWKGVDLTVFFTGVANRNTFLDLDGMWPFMLEYPAYNIFREYYDNRWIPGAADNSKAKYAAAIAGNNPNTQVVSTAYMRDASFLRLQNAEIGYTLPKSVLQKLNIDKIRFFLNGTNLYVWDKIKIKDPEQDVTGGYPTQRIINFGIHVDF